MPDTPGSTPGPSPDDPAAQAPLDAAVEAGRALLRQGHETARELLVLTDADLLVLDGVRGRAVAPRPWVATLDERQVEVAHEVARRGLAAHFGLGTPGREGEQARHLRLVLGLRRSATDILLAQRRSAQASSAVVAYLHGADGALVEETDASGGHRFVACGVGAALEAVRDWAAPPPPLGPPDGPDGVPVRHTRAEWEQRAGAELAGARLVTVVAGVRPDGDGSSDHRLAVHVLPDQVLMTTGAPTGDPGDEATGPLVEVAAVSRAGLLDRLARLLGR